MIYIAHPYTTGQTDLTLREILMKVADFAYSAHLQKLILYHPVLMGENILRWSGNLSNRENHSYKFWQRHNTDMISISTGLWILDIKGWDKSEGVTKEAHMAQFLSIPISLIHEEEDEYIVKRIQFAESNETGGETYEQLLGGEELRIEKHKA